MFFNESAECTTWKNFGVGNLREKLLSVVPFAGPLLPDRSVRTALVIIPNKSSIFVQGFVMGDTLAETSVVLATRSRVLQDELLSEPLALALAALFC